MKLSEEGSSPSEIISGNLLRNSIYFDNTELR